MWKRRQRRIPAAINFATTAARNLDVVGPIALCSFFLEDEMTNVTGRNLRIGLVTLVAAMLTASLGGEAVAKAHKSRVHARSAVYESHAEVVLQPGPMRYYGGPKSPMWRGPAE
jgi:hypothetical protein